MAEYTPGKVYVYVDTRIRPVSTDLRNPEDVVSFLQILLHHAERKG